MTFDQINLFLLDIPIYAANGLLCVVAPVRMLTFPPASSDAGANAPRRAIALELAWGEELGGATGVP